MATDVLGSYAVKKAGETLPFALDYSNELSSDTIASSVWIVPPGIVQPVLHPDTFAPRITTIWLEQGAVNTEYVLVNTVTTVGGAILVGILRVKINPDVADVPPAFTVGQLASLKSAYAQGAIRVRYSDKEVEYRSLAEMKTLIDEIEDSLAGNPSSTTKRFSLASHRKG
jgi:hypothetical protein